MATNIIIQTGKTAMEAVAEATRLLMQTREGERKYVTHSLELYPRRWFWQDDVWIFTLIVE
jgi:hypothetical protein